MTHIIFIGLLALLLFSCGKTVNNRKKTDKSDDDALTQQSCPDKPKTCSNGQTVMPFGENCEYLPCPDELTGAKVYYGFDIKGLRSSCTPKQNPNCTESLEIGDKYGILCESLGGVSYKCDCHNYLCSLRLQDRVGDIFKNPPPSDSNCNTSETKVCSNGQTVKKSEPNCQFQGCPGETKNGFFYGYNRMAYFDKCTIHGLNINPLTTEDVLFRSNCEANNGKTYLCRAGHYLCSVAIRPNTPPPTNPGEGDITPKDKSPGTSTWNGPTIKDDPPVQVDPNKVPEGPTKMPDMPKGPVDSGVIPKNPTSPMDPPITPVTPIGPKRVVEPPPIEIEKPF